MKDTDSLVTETVKEKIGLHISSSDIDRTHRIGATPKQSGKVRPTFVEYVRCNDWRKIHINKKITKGTKVAITESLTTVRVAKLKESKKSLG